MGTIINPHIFCLAYDIGFPMGYLVIIINTALITHITTQCGSIHKLDVENKEFTAHWEDPACRATEPQFVPRPGSTEEEDGVVVFACLGTDQESPSTWFVVLRPKDLKELGRFPVDAHTPVGFHGIWIPQKQQVVHQ